MADRPHWALLAPVEPAILEAALAAELAPFYPDTEERVWTITSGESSQGAYHALAWHRTGDEGLGEALAKSLSAGHDGTFYVLYLYPEDLMALAFEHGRGPRPLERHPYRLAAQLGIRLAGAPEDSSPLNASVCVAPGSTPAAVAQVFGLDEPPSDAPLHIESTSVGSAVYSDRGGIGMFLNHLAAALPGPIYCLTTDGSRFMVEIREGDRTLYFEHPHRELRDVEHVEEVLGKTDPREIARALAVDPAWLGWS